MHKSLIKNNTEIVYTMRSHHRAKRVRISVHNDGRVVVTKPVRVSAMRAEVMVENIFDWILRKIFELAHGPKKPAKILAHYSTKDFKENKQKAYDMVMSRIAFFNLSGEYRFARVTIRNQKSRWGSCSGKGNLSFNYKIVFLPEELQDYLIVHELSHLKEMNHSRAFWHLVAQKVPEHKARREKMRVY